MLQNVHTGVTKRLLVLAIMFTFSAMSLVIIKAANGDNNIVYKRQVITYYYCSPVDFEAGAPIYSKCELMEDGMEDADHPALTEITELFPKPIYGFVERNGRIVREIIGYDWVPRTRTEHTDHDDTVIWNQDIIEKKWDRHHWACR